MRRYCLLTTLYSRKLYLLTNLVFLYALPVFSCDLAEVVSPLKNQNAMFNPDPVDYDACEENKNDSSRFINEQLAFTPHINQVHNNLQVNNSMSAQPLGCRFCPQRFYFRASLKAHQKKDHTLEVQKLEWPKGQFICDDCGKAFIQGADLKKHLRVHTGERPFVCHVCRRGFTQKSNLTRHLKAVCTADRVGKKHQCQRCHFSCIRSDAFKRHIEMHQRDLLQTSYCELAVQAARGPQASEVVPNEDVEKEDVMFDKPYACQECPKRFRKNNGLKMHQRIHTGEKPYFCKTCFRLFSTRSDLQSHERIHTGKKMYECRKCGRTFIHRNRLNLHEKKHAIFQE